ncbi:MAG TPA: hypothetical protein VGE42_01705, partial [Candidatus Dormibacteraeota bacterium]
TGGRAAPRESLPAAELPRISTGGRTMLNRRQNCRASQPAAERPDANLNGGRSAEHHLDALSGG